ADGGKAREKVVGDAGAPVAVGGGIADDEYAEQQVDRERNDDERNRHRRRSERVEGLVLGLREVGAEQPADRQRLLGEGVDGPRERFDGVHATSCVSSVKASASVACLTSSRLKF